MSRATCLDCHGAGEIEAIATDPEGISRRRVPTLYACVECDGHGWVEVDPMADEEWEPVEPDDMSRVVRGESEAA